MYIRRDETGAFGWSGREAFWASARVDSAAGAAIVSGEAFLMALPRYACGARGIAAAIRGGPHARCSAAPHWHVSPRVGAARRKSSNQRGVTLRAAWSRGCYWQWPDRWAPEDPATGAYCRGVARLASSSKRGHSLLGAVIGNYQIIRKLGEGGMGAVYLGQHQLLGRRAAIKVLLPELSARPDIVNRFFNEARAVTSISDPGIVQVFDFGYHTDGSAFIVIEYLDGEPLDRRLMRLRRAPGGGANGGAPPRAGPRGGGPPPERPPPRP